MTNLGGASTGLATRRTSMIALFGGVAAMNTAMAGASTVSTLIAADATGPAWSGAPKAVAVLGTALGTLAMSAATVMASPVAHQSGLPFGLFLLGFGWNLVIVGGSS